ncbi:MAG: hypothetical protein WCG08_15495, partial [Paludibacter sp.]
MKKIFLFMAVALFCSANAFSQTTFTVNATTGTNNGTSWTTIDGAIKACASGDIIEISAGTYTEKALAIAKDLTIKGAGMGLTIIQPLATQATGNGATLALTTNGNTITL